MRKQKEVIDAIKSLIRDKLAWKPFLSVHQMQASLFHHGYRSASGGLLDWHFVSKTMKKVRVENIEKLGREDRSERLSQLKERFRIVADTLVEIIQGQTSINKDGQLACVTPTERIMAINTLLKWETAMFYAEESKTHSNITFKKPELIGVRKPKKNKIKKWEELLPGILKT